MQSTVWLSKTVYVGALALAVAVGFSTGLRPAVAQGWGPPSYDRDPDYGGPDYDRGTARNLDVYPDDYSDADIEAAERARRSYERNRWYRDGDPEDPDGSVNRDDRRWQNDRRNNQDDGYDREDRNDNASRERRPTETHQVQKPRAPKTGEFAPGPRPYIQPKAPPIVAFHANYPVGSIVIDTSARKLYYVLSPRTAYAYPIGVGRQGFAWTGTEKVSRIADWPDWYPPADMRKRQPYLPERMLGGINNPLGAKAIYLGNTLYRIHGTNDPKSIGKARSSGCFRMMNQNVEHLAGLVHVGTPVTVLRKLGDRATIARAPTTNKDWRRSPRNRDRYARRYPSDEWGYDPRYDRNAPDDFIYSYRR